ncbi:hypothetical protein SDJN02_09490, partial [Cucurbita argyrosperma subsp. argyrosperma]
MFISYLFHTCRLLPLVLCYGMRMLRRAGKIGEFVNEKQVSQVAHYNIYGTNLLPEVKA